LRQTRRAKSATIFSKRSRECHFGNESLTQFFELGRIFAQQKGAAE
jgi:hypothetical protein